MTKSLRDKSRGQNAHNTRLIRFMIGLVCVCLAFAGGFALRGNGDLLERMGFNTAAATQSVNPGATVSGNTYDSLSARLAEVQGILNTSSLDTYDLETATSAVINATTASSSDAYLRYYDETHYQTYLKDTSEKYAGIGVLLGENEGKAYAVDVFDGSEADSKGVQVGDYIVAIDGDRGSDGWTQATAVKAIARNEGEEVVVTWRRPSTLNAAGGTEYTVTLSCSTFNEPNVTTELSDNVGYIKVSQITQNADTLVHQAVSSLVAQGAQSFVLDLRDNPGGYLTQAVDLTSLFVKSGVVVEIQTKEGTTTRSASGSIATDAPLVVLVNGNTASCAEVIAGALQDNNRATVIGEKTLGKGSVQSVQQLTFGGALRYTSAYYKTPRGYSIEGSGINPDIQVGLSAGSTDDVQKTLAIETATSLIRS